LVSSLIRRNLL